METQMIRIPVEMAIDLYHLYNAKHSIINIFADSYDYEMKLIGGDDVGWWRDRIIIDNFKLYKELRDIFHKDDIYPMKDFTKKKSVMVTCRGKIFSISWNQADDLGLV